MIRSHHDVGVAAGALLASASTLICCVLPAVLVSLGAGATLVSLVSAFPQLVWLSERKSMVFTVATLVLIAAGVWLWRARSLPCPVDAAAARQCARLRRVSAACYVAACLFFSVGAAFAFLLPAIA